MTYTQAHIRRAIRCLSVAVFAVTLTVSAGAATAQDTIKLGFIGPMSGGNALQGLGAKNAFMLAIRQANESGYPYDVEGVPLDDASQPSVGVNAALKLVNDPDMVAAIGHWNSPVALATIPIFNRANMPFIIWGAISPKITEQNIAQVTRVTPTLAQENEPLAAWLVNDLGYKRIAILSTTDDYGQQNVENFQDYAKDNGAEIVSVDSLPSDATNFKPVLARIKHNDPDVLYFGGVIAPAALVRKQMSSIGLDVPLAAVSGVYDPKYTELAGDSANGTLVTVPQVKANTRLQQFEKDYAAANFDNPHGPYGKYAYDAAKILLKVIREHGTDDPDALVEAVRNIDYKGVLGETTFDDHGQTQIEITADHYTVKDGEWVPYADSGADSKQAAKSQ